MERLTYTVPEVAKAFGTSPRAVYDQVALGHIGYIRIQGRGTEGKGRILIPAEELKRFIKENTTPAKQYTEEAKFVLLGKRAK